MLTRAARRRQALQWSKYAAEQIQLPWLCPALHRDHTQLAPVHPITPHPAKRQRLRPTQAPTKFRRLASAASVTHGIGVDDDYLPFHRPGANHTIAHSKSNAALLSALEPLDVSQVLMLDGTLMEAPTRLRTRATKGVEILGNADEVETTLDACLQVQRWDRALALLKHLEQIQPKGSERLLATYNRCLQAMVFDMLVNKNRKTVDQINKWVEVEMRRAHVKPDARTYALRIKVALATLQGTQRDRTVQRYWEKAKLDAVEFEVASLREILTDRDLGKLSEICPINIDFELDPEEYPNEETIELAPDESIALKGPDSTTHKGSMAIRETVQKGLGLTSLRKSLALFSGDVDIKREQFEGTDEEVEHRYAEARQMRLEDDAIDSAIERWRLEHQKMEKMGIVGNLQHGKLGAILWQWQQVLVQRLGKEMEDVARAESKAKKTPQDKIRSEYGPFLRLLTSEHLAASTILTVLQTMSKTGMSKPITVVTLVSELGKQIEAEVAAGASKGRAVAGKGQDRRRSGKPSTNLETKAAESAQFDEHHSLIPNSQTSRHEQRHFWSNAIRARVGAVLCELLFDSAKIPMSKKDSLTGKMLHISQPAFMKESLYKAGRKVGAMSLHTGIVEMAAVQPAGNLIAKQLPMLSKPRPWTSFTDGGCLHTNVDFVRIKNREAAQREYAMAAAARGDLDQVFAGTDVLSRTAWRINSNVFNVMLEAWNSGEEIANFPPAEKLFPEIPMLEEGADRQTRRNYHQLRRDMANQKSGLHSQRCYQNFQMEIARSFLHDTFYLPHNVDFRGRAYPIPPYLNQMGADNCRGLLLFDNGKELGAGGLRWLKIHLANVFGYDKASLSDRENFATMHRADIEDSVKNPLAGRRWWLTGEDPWQCLATCFELHAALELNDPTKFVSHLPVHQDGSCNGLQHYAALGGDIAGAKQVNLEPGDRPADVYTGVAELVKAEIKEDAERGDELAQQLNGKITRKMVKQTVMTNVYGVTFLGAIRQVRKQLDVLLPELKDHEKPLNGIAATYIARKIFKGLGAMFTGAHGIQYWLGDCANRISSSLTPAQLQKLAETSGVVFKDHVGKQKISSWKQEGTYKATARTYNSKTKDPLTFRSSVIWTTPLKLPVVQPYRVSKGHRVKTNLQEVTIAEPTVADSVDKRKQLQAFPPNFIHSLDATHMILSALKCDEYGLTFSAVHDSFWTHAADVDVLNRLLRDAFIRMHSDDIIRRLAAEFNTRYKDHLYLAQVKAAGPLGQAIKQYRRGLEIPKGSRLPQKQQVELLREIERRKLMRSGDPMEREKGEKMVTAASLYEQHDGDAYLHHKDSLGQTAIGAVPKALEEGTIETAIEDAEESYAENVDMAQSINPLVQDFDADSTTQIVDAGNVVAAGDDGAVAPKKSERAKGPKVERLLWVWLPLTFRPVPPKGDFDVTRLRDSQYFFS